ncbi:MAG: GNAT family N-acetyltransferase [Myxococcaceae bacterium]|nr:GNAT family N-acetyltransferase [Myxococcaceae bacterium]
MAFALRHATAAEQRQRDLVTYAAWGQKLTQAQFEQREARLRAHPWALGAMETWLWTEDGRVLASCETFRTDASLGPWKGAVWAIASVFTEAPLRGRGFAKAMLEALLQVLRGRPGALGAVLFSEVGAKLYEAVGFRTVAASDLVFPASQQSWPAGVQRLTRPLGAPVPAPAPGALKLHPSAAQLDWHLERSAIYSELLRAPLGEVFGAAHEGAALWWAPYFKTQELLVLWAEGAPDRLGPLLEAARGTAGALGLHQVRCWKVPALPTVGAREVPRDGELPMVCSFVPQLSTWDDVQRALWV